MQRACFPWLAFGLLTASLGACGEEPGTTCKSAPVGGWSEKCTPVREPICGNGWVERDEECDDGNDVSGDGCEPDCTIIPVCGNAVPEPGEECDDGDDVSGDGCEADCSFLPVAVEPACLGSTPVLDDEGRFVLDEDDVPIVEDAETTEPDEDGACTFYLWCPIPSQAAFPIEVRPLPTVVAGEGRARARLEQTLFVTSALQVDLPLLDDLLIEGGSVQYALEARSASSPFSADATNLIGPVPLPTAGAPPAHIDFEVAETELAYSMQETFSVTLTGIGLSVSILADELRCEVVGEASVLYSPTTMP